MKREKLLILIISLIIISTATLVLFIYFKKDSKTLEIKVQTNGGVPYKWEYEIADNTIVKYLKKDTLKKDETKDGGIVYINFVFKGLKEGKTTIKLKYVNIIDESIEKETIYNIKVDKNRNISLINKRN